MVNNQNEFNEKYSHEEQEIKIKYKVFQGELELVISTCPDIETLNVRKNNLTSLEFMVNLRNLTELDIEGNPKLDEILKPYGGD
ncbi:813_t:CDS:2 [Entrophospora sp. SA101]|nr:813_t:CDS:2 [Entrophospora sp. SA101]